MNTWLTTQRQLIMVSAGALLCLFAAPAGVLAGTADTRVIPPSTAGKPFLTMTTGDHSAGSSPHSIGGDSCGYPTATRSPLTATTFSESTVTQGIEVIGTGSSAKIAAFTADEKGLLLGIGATPFSGSGPQHVTDPSLGDLTAKDPSGRLLYPTIFVTDITSDPSSRAGDWQQGGAPSTSLSDVFGTWTTATLVAGSYTPIPPSVSNPNWDLGPGADQPPATAQSDRYNAEVRWNASDLHLTPGHNYRFQVITHDGDQNKSGGDAGEVCTTLTLPVAAFHMTKTVSPTGSVPVGTELTYTVTESNTSTTSGDAGTVTDTINTVGGATYAIVAGSLHTTQGTATLANPTISWPVGVLPGGTSAVLTVKLTVTAAGTGPTSAVVNTAVNPSTNCAAANDAACTTTTALTQFRLAKSVVPGLAVTVGTPLHYSVTITNAGQAAGDPGTVIDTITTTGGATYAVTTAPSSAAGTVTGANPTYTWNPGTMAAGSSATLTATLTVTGTGAGPNSAIDNTAVNSSSNCVQPNTAGCTTTNPVTNFQLAKTVSPAGPVPLGTPLTYTVTITNLTGTAGDPGVVHDTPALVGGAAFDVIRTAVDAGSLVASRVDGPRPASYDWTVGALGPHDSASFTSVVVPTTASGPSAVVVNTAYDANTNCVSPGTTGCTTVTPLVTLTLTKTVFDDTAKVDGNQHLAGSGDRLTYTVTVTNTSGVGVANLTVDDVLGGDASFTVADGTNATANSFAGNPTVTVIKVAANHYSWTYAALAPGQAATVTFDTTIFPGTGRPLHGATFVLDNTASVPGYTAATTTVTNTNNQPAAVTVVTDVAPGGGVLGCTTSGSSTTCTSTPNTGAGIQLNVTLAGFLFLGGLALILLGMLVRAPEGSRIE